MVSPNVKTLKTYDAHPQEYIDSTTHEISDEIRQWLAVALDGLPTNARILEIGSAFGCDTEYIETLGYHVDCTDATPSFVTYLREHGHNATLYNAITDHPPQNLDAVIANAVFLHFTPEETHTVAKKLFDALSPTGRLAITLKEGDGEERTNDKLGEPRYFCYWREDSVTSVFEKIGFKNIFINRSKKGETDWLEIVAMKP